VSSGVLPPGCSNTSMCARDSEVRIGNKFLANMVEHQCLAALAVAVATDVSLPQSPLSPLLSPPLLEYQPFMVG
jgi:hypothetical protein